MNPVVNSDVTPFDPILFKKFTHFSKLHTRQVAANSFFNRPARRSISLHKRQVDLCDILVEAFDFGHKHSDVERLIL